MSICKCVTGLGRNHSVPILRSHDLYVQSNLTMNQRMQVIITVLNSPSYYDSLITMITIYQYKPL